MIVNEKSFTRRYSFIYTFIVSIVLLAPLSIYINHEVTVQELKTELALRSIQVNSINAMEKFGDNPEMVFDFPIYASFKSGLYAKDFTPIYTQIKSSLPSYMSGYHIQGSERFLITQLPSQKYFFAEYLITKTEISYASVFLQASVIAFGIIALILLLSFYFLKSFSRPFRRVNEKLDDFIKESMHEINTPLSIINVNIDLLNAVHGESKYSMRIKSATKSLATIYNDMDYLIKQDRLEYKSQPIHFENFLEERIEYFKLICQLKNIELHYLKETDTIIEFNPTKLERLIDNTLSNAVKFSFKDSKIEVSTHYTKNGSFIFSVKDYGQGIKNPKEIMKRYYREDEYKNGFGIGMNIVKSIIDEAGIKLEVISKLNHGSNFIYTIDTSMIQTKRQTS